MKKQYYLIIVMLAILNLNLSLNLKSQVAVNTSGEPANGSAMLDVSSTEKGILIPRMNVAQRDLIDTPITGLMIYQTDNTPGFYFYDGSAWVVVGNGATTINSLYDGASDGSSVFLGNGAGANDNGTTNQNLGYGISALNANINGYENTAIGIEALKLVEGGHHNTALGIHSLSSITTGSSNTALGTNAGISNTGSGNIFIGANAAYNELGSNKLFIENSASATPLIYGEFDSNLLRFNGTLELSNGTSASSLKFFEPSGSGTNYTRFITQAQAADVTYTLPVDAGTNGQLLKTDGSGSLSWADDTNTGATDIDGLSDGLSDGNSLFMGADAGNLAGSNKFNTGLGVWSLKDVTTGLNNTALGTSSLMSLTEGSNNTVIGTNALQTITTTSNNTVLGTSAGQSVTGSGNVFIGNEVAKTQIGISNKLFIDNSDTINPLIYGDFENDMLRVNGTLDINSAYQLPTTDGTNGQVLKSNGSGSLNWADDTNTGATDINGLSDGITGGTSVYLGYAAGIYADLDNTSFNTGVGYKVLLSCRTGVRNVAFGNHSLWYNYYGSNNTAIGSFSGSNNYGGSGNVTLGCYADNDNASGSNNTVIGSEAGGEENSTTTIRNGCVFIGHRAGLGATGDNKLYIDNSDTIHPLIWGDFESNNATINGNLNVTGSLSLNGDDMDINGLADGKTGGNSVFLGTNAGVADDGSDNNNVAVGNSSLNNNITGSNNTAVGKGALYSNVTGTGNVTIGNEAGYNETGSNKLYVANSDDSTPLIYGEFDNDLVIINGDFEVTGNLNITGEMGEIDNLGDANCDGSSLFLGVGSGLFDEGGNQNLGIGINSLSVVSSGSGNTSLGYESLKLVTTGDGNLALGHSSLSSVTIGNDNVALGKHSGLNNTGSGNIFIGAHAGTNETGSDKLYISNTTDSTPLIYGELNNDLIRINGDFEVVTPYNNTKFGIYALSSNYDGHSNTAIGREAMVSNDEGDNNTAIGLEAMQSNTEGSHNVAVGRSAMTNNTDGNENTAVGADARCSSPSSGNFGVFGYNTVTTGSDSYRFGNSSVHSIGGQVGWSSYSDGRFKRNVQKNVPGLDFILKLEPVSYNWDIHKLDDFIGATEGTERSEHMREARRKQEAKTYTGFIAQDVEKATKEIGYNFSGVETPPNDGTPYSLRYAEFVVPLVKAVQEQQEMIELLKEQNKMLIVRIEKLEEK